MVEKTMTWFCKRKCTYCLPGSKKPRFFKVGDSIEVSEKTNIDNGLFEMETPLENKAIDSKPHPSYTKQKKAEKAKSTDFFRHGQKSKITMPEHMKKEIKKSPGRPKKKI